MKKRKNKNAACETCGNCLPIGEGDHICSEYGDGTPKLVIEGYCPGPDYLGCGGKCYEADL